jgi:hypothetical protein
MTDIDEANTSSISTNWRWIKAKIDPHPQGTGQRTAGAPSKPRRRRRDLRARTQIVVTYRGGPEASYLVCYENRCWRYPGHWCLHDVMQHLLEKVAAS